MNISMVNKKARTLFAIHINTPITFFQLSLKICFRSSPLHRVVTFLGTLFSLTKYWLVLEYGNRGLVYYLFFHFVTKLACSKKKMKGLIFSYDDDGLTFFRAQQSIAAVEDRPVVDGAGRAVTILRLPSRAGRLQY